MKLLGTMCLAFLGSAMLIGCANAADIGRTPRVHTTSGWLTGRQDGKLESYLGVPYAAAPVGELRWQPPRPFAPLGKDLDARAFREQCAQVKFPGLSGPFPAISEDCLFLNIWTPGTDSHSRPVMVFIHGGAFLEGGTNGSYDGSALAQRGGLVFVNLQYRVGSFGFLELDQAGGTRFAASGNLGILDQIAALKWIHANIAAFGGDPNNVTLFGESAGAVSVATLMSLGETQGLYAKAILESPRAPFIVGKVRARQVAQQLIELSGAKDFAHFKALDTHAVMAAQEALFEARFEDTSFSPVLDGQLIKEPSQTRILAGTGVRVPTIFGTNLEELEYWQKDVGYPLDQFTPDLLARHLQPLLGERSREVVDLYRRDNVDHTATTGNIMLLSDLTFRMASIRMAEAHSKSTPTWMYLFAYRGGEFGAGHGEEVAYVFDRDTPAGSVGSVRDRAGLHRAIQDSWIAFARSGDPNNASVPTWPRYTETDRATLVFDTNSRVVPDPYGSLRQAWHGVPFDGLVPDIDQASGLMTLGGGGKYFHWGPQIQ